MNNNEKQFMEGLKKPLSLEEIVAFFDVDSMKDQANRDLIELRLSSENLKKLTSEDLRKMREQIIQYLSSSSQMPYFFGNENKPALVDILEFSNSIRDFLERLKIFREGLKNIGEILQERGEE